MNPLVSVIIPVYNTGEYLRQALDSILNQSLEDIEIIAVNDGSTDDSGDILREYSDRIIIIDKANGGQAAARNDAMGIATGRYIYFFDSDDILEPDALEKCYELCEKDYLDFAFFDAVTFGDDNLIAENPWYIYDRARFYLSPRSGLDTITDMLENGRYKCSVCMSLFRHSFLQNYALKFYPGITYEDELFSAIAYFKASRVEGIPRQFYQRRLHDGSTVTSKYTLKKYNSHLTVVDQIRRQTPHSKQHKNASRLLIGEILHAMCYNAYDMDFLYRLKLALIIIFKYPYAAKLHTLGVLLLKKILK